MKILQTINKLQLIYYQYVSVNNECYLNGAVEELIDIESFVKGDICHP